MLDEPEQIRGAAERLWKRLDQQSKTPRELAAASFFIGRISKRASPRAAKSLSASWI